MNPSNKEMQLRKTCELYAYLLKSLGKEVPEHIEECSESYDYVIDCKKELFSTLKGLDSVTFERIVENTFSAEARALANWWNMYQEAERLKKILFSDS
jgi:hypothetical protein